ncbi:hypothetical protein [Brevirhabdus sp.]|uniref:hypothetical protein n=1 Tax=Brevirhabdus sp. TaxID=2004514 RepID=UPI004059AE48
MSNLTIRMDPVEKDRLKAWAAVRGTSASDYIKDLVARDMAVGTPQDRAAAWFRENAAAIAAEAEHIERSGIPGSHLAMHHPWPDAEI